MAAGTTADREPIVGINITPLVDVCLVLVIIFMVATPMFVQPNLPVELPQARTVEGEDSDNVTVTVTKDGRWAVNEVELPAAEVPAALKAKVEASRDRHVIVRADREARYAYALEALRFARAAGAKVMAIATEQKPRGEAPGQGRGS